jgi:uncharacterized phage-associated protein
MQFNFNEKKAAQAASHLLERAGGTMPYIKLLKLMYLADRRALIEQGLMITGDRMVAMPQGMVLSQVLNLIRGQVRGEWWPRYVRPVQVGDVALVDTAETSSLSEFEVEILDSVFDQYGAMDKWALVDHLHETLKEWKDPQGSSFVVKPEDVLRAENISEDDIADRQMVVEDINFLTH